MSNKKISMSYCISLICIAVALSVTFTTIVVMNKFAYGKNSAVEQEIFQRIKEIDAKIEENFYSIEPVDDTDLVDGAATGYVDAYGDKYTVYYTKEEYEQIQMGNEGVGVGIGITVSQNDNGQPTVYRVAPGSPAEKNGVKVGDIITMVGTESSTDLGFEKTISAMLGEENTVCDFTVDRAGELINFKITREKYDEQSVITKQIDDILLIQILSFNTATVGQFEAALKQAETVKAKGIIFDVRNNGGGTLESVTQMIDMVCPQGSIGSIDYKNGTSKDMGESDANEVSLPMACLINQNTASAAELFCADLHDFNKAKLIGVKTYGKGIMQNTYPLSDGTAIRMTVAEFNPHSGINFHGEGVQPDIEVTLTKEQEDNFYALNETNDPQLMAAIDYINSVTETTNVTETK